MNRAMLRACARELEKLAGGPCFDREYMTDDQEALDNIRINAHFFHKDNTEMHPAHRRLIKMLERGAESQLLKDGFVEELAKIGDAQIEELASPARVAYELRKEAGLVKESWAINVGNVLTAGRLASAKTTGRGMARNAIETVKGVAHPLREMAAGWNVNDPLIGHGWWGQKMKLKGKQGLDKAIEYGSSLGGLTEHLPVGPKSMTLAGAAAMAPGALSKEDKSGKDRSRAERVGGFIGNTAGGLMGMNHGVTGSIVGMVGGEAAGGVGGKVLNKVIGRKKKIAPPPQATPDLPVNPQAKQSVIEPGPRT